MATNFSNGTHIENFEQDPFLATHYTLAKWVHFSRAIIAIAALLPNILMLILFRQTVRRDGSANLIIHAIATLSISNILMCTVLCVYSFMKAFCDDALQQRVPCLAMTWLAVFASFEPIWSMELIAIARVVKFCMNANLKRRATQFRMMLIRFGLSLLAALMTSFIVLEVNGKYKSARCNYQMMLDDSMVYLVFSLVIVIALVSTGGASMILRMLLRKRLLRQVHALEKLQTVDGMADVKSAVLVEKIPTLVWKQPKIILMAIVVCVLFLVPRVAFVCGSRPFWLFSTLCPALMAAVLPLCFLDTSKELKHELKMISCSICDAWSPRMRKMRNEMENSDEIIIAPGNI